MTKANKVGEGVYRTDDGQWELVKYGDEFRINQLVGTRWTRQGTAKTLAAAEKELTRLTKSEEPEPEPEQEEEKVAAVIETEEATGTEQPTEDGE